MRWRAEAYCAFSQSKSDSLSDVLANKVHAAARSGKMAREASLRRERKRKIMQRGTAPENIDVAAFLPRKVASSLERGQKLMAIFNGQKKLVAVD